MGFLALLPVVAPTIIDLLTKAASGLFGEETTKVTNMVGAALKGGVAELDVIQKLKAAKDGGHEPTREEILHLIDQIKENSAEIAELTGH